MDPTTSPVDEDPVDPLDEDVFDATPEEVEEEVVSPMEKLPELAYTWVMLLMFTASRV